MGSPGAEHDRVRVFNEFIDASTARSSLLDSFRKLKALSELDSRFEPSISAGAALKAACDGWRRVTKAFMVSHAYEIVSSMSVVDDLMLKFQNQPHTEAQSKLFSFGSRWLSKYAPKFDRKLFESMDTNSKVIAFILCRSDICDLLAAAGSEVTTKFRSSVDSLTSAFVPECCTLVICLSKCLRAEDIAKLCSQFSDDSLFAGSIFESSEHWASLVDRKYTPRTKPRALAQYLSLLFLSHKFQASRLKCLTQPHERDKMRKALHESDLGTALLEKLQSPCYGTPIEPSRLNLDDEIACCFCLNVQWEASQSAGTLAPSCQPPQLAWGAKEPAPLPSFCMNLASMLRRLVYKNESAGRICNEQYKSQDALSFAPAASWSDAEESVYSLARESAVSWVVAQAPVKPTFVRLRSICRTDEYNVDISLSTDADIKGSSDFCVVVSAALGYAQAVAVSPAKNVQVHAGQPWAAPLQALAMLSQLRGALSDDENSHRIFRFGVSVKTESIKHQDHRPADAGAAADSTGGQRKGPTVNSNIASDGTPLQKSHADDCVLDVLGAASDDDAMPASSPLSPMPLEADDATIGERGGPSSSEQAAASGAGRSRTTLHTYLAGLRVCASCIGQQALCGDCLQADQSLDSEYPLENLSQLSTDLQTLQTFADEGSTVLLNCSDFYLKMLAESRQSDQPIPLMGGIPIFCSGDGDLQRKYQGTLGLVELKPASSVAHTACPPSIVGHTVAHVVRGVPTPQHAVARDNDASTMPITNDIQVANVPSPGGGHVVFRHSSFPSIVQHCAADYSMIDLTGHHPIFTGFNKQLEVLNNRIFGLSHILRLYQSEEELVYSVSMCSPTVNTDSGARVAFRNIYPNIIAPSKIGSSQCDCGCVFVGKFGVATGLTLGKIPTVKVKSDHPPAKTQFLSSSTLHEFSGLPGTLVNVHAVCFHEWMQAPRELLPMPISARLKLWLHSHNAKECGTGTDFHLKHGNFSQQGDSGAAVFSWSTALPDCAYEACPSDTCALRCLSRHMLSDPYSQAYSEFGESFITVQSIHDQCRFTEALVPTLPILGFVSRCNSEPFRPVFNDPGCCKRQKPSEPGCETLMCPLTPDILQLSNSRVIPRNFKPVHALLVGIHSSLMKLKQVVSDSASTAVGESVEDIGQAASTVKKPFDAVAEALQEYRCQVEQLFADYKKGTVPLRGPACSSGTPKHAKGKLRRGRGGVHPTRTPQRVQIYIQYSEHVTAPPAFIFSASYLLQKRPGKSHDAYPPLLAIHA